MFAKYDCDEKGGLTITDLWSLWNGQKLVFDFFGWTATALEWTAVYLLWPDAGVVREEDVRGVFDGSIFYKKAEHAANQEAQRTPVYRSLIERSQRISSSLLTAVFRVLSIPRAIATGLWMKVKDLFPMMHDVW